MLNKSKGNMYGFVTHTWNPINGKCIHDCIYCYMKVYKLSPLYLSEKSLKDNLGKDNFIFVGSSTDIFADNVPSEWIIKVLNKCNEYNNKYLFQTKNPKRFKEFEKEFPSNSIFAITIETNRSLDYNKFSKAPSPFDRVMEFFGEFDYEKRMVSIEPIMDFDLDELVSLIDLIAPKFVSIGADSKGHNLPEPSKEKILALIEQLNEFTKVIQKDNLGRLLK